MANINKFYSIDLVMTSGEVEGMKNGLSDELKGLIPHKWVGWNKDNVLIGCVNYVIVELPLTKVVQFFTMQTIYELKVVQNENQAVELLYEAMKQAKNG